MYCRRLAEPVMANGLHTGMNERRDTPILFSLNAPLLSLLPEINISRTNDEKNQFSIFSLVFWVIQYRENIFRWILSLFLSENSHTRSAGWVRSALGRSEINFLNTLFCRPSIVEEGEKWIFQNIFSCSSQIIKLTIQMENDIICVEYMCFTNYEPFVCWRVRQWSNTELRKRTVVDCPRH